MVKEKYYAVRIGSRPKNCPYLMLRNGCDAPQLYALKADAENKLEGRPERTVVRVEVREMRKAPNEKS